MKLGRSNQTGGAFQTRLESTLLGYRKAGRADIEKIDPPVKVLGGGKLRRVIFMENPWLDYGGTWTEQGGRAIYLEAKSTQDPRLPVEAEGGLTTKQVAALKRWSRARAAAAVVWEHAGEMRILTAREILDACNAGARSIRWRHVPAIHRGTGLVEFDILAELENRLLQ